MHLAHHGLDKGAKPIQFVLHAYSLENGELLHFTDDQLRATVPPEGFVDFVVDHPEAAPLLRYLVPDLETRAGEARLARAVSLDAIRHKVSAGADQNAISKIVDAAVAKALAQFIEMQKRALAAPAAGEA